MPACMCVRFPETGVIDDCEPSFGYCESNLGGLEQAPVLLSTEPSLHALISFISQVD